MATKGFLTGPELAKAKMRSIGGASRGRVNWDMAKDKAKAAGLTVSGFNKKFGPRMDGLRDICQSVDELCKLHGVEPNGIDAEWKTAIKQRADLVQEAADHYRNECDRKAEKHPEQKKEWAALKRAVGVALSNANSGCSKYGPKVN